MASSAAALRMIMTDPINEALIIYTGFGNSPFPRAKTPSLVARFGDTAGAELKQRIVGAMPKAKLVAELGGFLG